MATVSIIIPVYNMGEQLNRMFASLRAQTFHDYEVIFVNDGSTDNTKKVLEDFAKKDKRVVIIHQTNQGVSSARNVGLDKAGGKYICFWDADDSVPRNALKNMLKVMKSKDADLVIGAMKRISSTESLVFLKTRTLCKKDKIQKNDLDLVYSFSLANKMLRRAIIEKYHIRFAQIKHAEDGLFLYQYLNWCNNIRGCKNIVYHYHRELPLFSESATQAMAGTMLYDALEALTLISEHTKEFGDVFHEELNKRAIKVTLLGEYYRKIWRLDDEVVKVLIEKVREYKTKITANTWERIVKELSDLQLVNGILTKDELANTPIFSIVISKKMSPGHLPVFLDSLYKQSLPKFEVIIPIAVKSFIPKNYQEMKNIVWWNGDVTQIPCKGKYSTYIDDDIVYNDDTLVRAYKKLENSDVQFIIANIRQYCKNGKATHSQTMDAIFLYKRMKMWKRDTWIDELDSKYSNKFFQTSPFLDCMKQDGKYELKHLQYQCAYRVYVLNVYENQKALNEMNMSLVKKNILYTLSFLSIIEEKIIELLKKMLMLS